MEAPIRYARSGAVHIAYRIFGDGPRDIVLIPGTISHVELLWELVGDGVVGIAVHIGARGAALAGPDEVLVSSTVRDLVAGSGLRFVDRGTHSLKGVPDDWRLFVVQ